MNSAPPLASHVRGRGRPGAEPAEGTHLGPARARPVVKVRGAGGGRVSIAGVACYRPGDRPHLFYQLRVYRRRKGEAKGFTWQDYRDLIIAAHRSLSAPLVWCWDNLNTHLAPELADFAAENTQCCGSAGCPRARPTLIPRGDLVAAQAGHGQLRRR
ncbi:MAG TPA: hypothetical protein VGR98_02630 [Streptosporangiaceae bacterium]|nr:hypothetical protein [Streptosporangiaceae bacterium]